MRKLRGFFIIISILILISTGCTDTDDTSDVIVSPEQSASGGVLDPAENINLKSIDIAINDGITALTLSLLSGSREAGYPESKLTKLPEYEVTSLAQPQRIMVKLQNISFWDYEHDDNLAFSDFVLGVFQEVPADDDSLIIYIQLSQAADIDIQEAEGDLILKLKPTVNNDTAKYYCVSDSFYEHQDGSWPDNIDMTPVLCSDNESRLLISAPFETQEDADAYLETANDAIADILPENRVYVTRLPVGALPDYAPDTDYSLANQHSPIIEDGILADTPLLLQNGRYLDTAADGRIAFSRSYKPDEPALEQNAYLLSDKLWILNPNGRSFSIDESNFYTIDQAAFSIDGRYICILDVSIEDRVLYVYDFDTETPINLGEEGFGSQTAAFAWSDIDNTLYAMTGSDAMQMMSCTFLADGSLDIGTVEEQAGAEGQLAVSQGRLIFADNYAKEGGVIYEVADERRELTDGIDFCVSPDGTLLLVREIQPSESLEEEQVLTSLKLYDIASGEVTQIVERANIESFCFSQNGGKVYYNNAISDEDEEIAGYDYALYAYDTVIGTSELIGFCSTGVFAPSSEAGQIYLIDNIYDDTGSFYATYVYDIN